MKYSVPRYPVYVISKGRSDCCLTARFLRKDGTPFYIVVEPQEKAEYAKEFPSVQLLVTPFSNLGQGSIPVRNWVWEHAKSTGAKRHWIIDDNIRWISRRYNSERIPCDSGTALFCCEDFVERYKNIAVAGLGYEMFATGVQKLPPFRVNCHIYSCLLILNSLPWRWRGRYNEDTDLCLQVLADGWCTVAFNAFLIKKTESMVMKGGNTDELYQGEGRLKMARSLERLWPGVVTVGRRFNRPQHIVKYAWKKFDTPLKLKPGIKIDPTPNEYGMVLKRVKPEKHGS